MLFGMDDEHYLIIGLHLQLPGVRLISVDLAGNLLDELELFDAVAPAAVEIIGAALGASVHFMQNYLNDLVIS